MKGKKKGKKKVSKGGVTPGDEFDQVMDGPSGRMDHK
jgi:hypothetical protein